MIAVNEFRKPNWHPCKHQAEIGCSIYNERPSCCAHFKCLWLNGTIGIDDIHRPEKLGLMFSELGVLDKVNKHELFCVGAWEVWPNAAESKDCKEILEKLAMKHIVIIITRSGGPYRVIGNILGGDELADIPMPTY
jgi:Fe-S-cluster containining protein